MSSSESNALSTVHALRTSFKSIFGDLATHAAVDHRTATSMVPRTLVDGRLVPIPQSVADLIQHSPELASWAEDLPSNTRKLLIIKPHPLLDSVQPRGWHTAEILNQSLPDRLHGRQTIILQHWCYGWHPSILLPSLIMQLLSSPVFNDDHSRPPKMKASRNREKKFPLLYEEHALKKRDVAYLTRIFHRLIGLLSDRLVTVYCVLDAVDCLAGQSTLRSESQMADVLRCLFALVRFSCKGRKNGVDFRILLMGPTCRDGESEFMQHEKLRRIMVEHGVVLAHGREEEAQQPQLPQAVDSDSADDGSQSTGGSWQTARSGPTDGESDASLYQDALEN